MAVQWLGLGTFIASTQVQFLVWVLRSSKSCGMAKWKKVMFRLKHSLSSIQYHYV